MKFSIVKALLFILPDILLFMVLFFLYSKFSVLNGYVLYQLISIVIALMVIRVFILYFGDRFYFKRKIDIIKEVLLEFKKGKFSQSSGRIRGNNELTEIFDELVIVGKHFDSIVTYLKREIDNFHELYNSIIFSLNSYFIILDEDERVVFANEGFHKKFQFKNDEIYNKRIEDFFYFVNARLRGGISQVKRTGESIVLEKTHLLTLNKVSIIADIKISNIIVKDKNQIIIIIDDITKKLRSDYQISLMSQISESIQKDEEIDRVFYTILTGVTSGSGLGFNRAMLFLVDEGYLVGKMAVGPDSFEKAIDIWSATSQTGSFIEEIELSEIKSGGKLLEKVLDKQFPITSENIITQSLTNKENIHVYDAWSDENVDEEIRDFIDVKEFVIIPLIVINQVIGLIIADNKYNNTPISKEAIELLSIFASQAAMSIESYKNLDKVRNEMEKISKRQEAIVESEKHAAIGRIAAHLAHEIRNPLVTMGGYARRIIQLQKDKIKDEKKIDKAAEIILKESERLEKTLSNVMDFSKPARFIKEFSNINEIIKDTVRLLKNIFKDKKLEVKMNLCDDIPLVKSDFNQMKQVMLNLLQNSIDATPSGGFIEIETNTDNEYVYIIISDNGPEIEEDDPNIVFEPFFSTKVTGVGLGLAVVKKIIKDHNGIIEVANRDEGGVEFVIRLSIPG